MVTYRLFHGIDSFSSYACQCTCLIATHTDLALSPGCEKWLMLFLDKLQRNEFWLMDFLIPSGLSIILVTAAFLDWRTRKLPNYLTCSTMLAGLFYHGLTKGQHGLVFSVAGMALGIGLLFLPYLMGMMGAGDAKLMGGVGAVLGPIGLLNAFLLTCLCGGLLSVIVLLGGSERSMKPSKNWGTSLKLFLATGSIRAGSNFPAGRKVTLPYGVAIAAGTMLYMFLKSKGCWLPLPASSG